MTLFTSGFIWISWDSRDYTFCYTIIFLFIYGTIFTFSLRHALWYIFKASLSDSSSPDQFNSMLGKNIRINSNRSLAFSFSKGILFMVVINYHLHFFHKYVAQRVNMQLYCRLEYTACCLFLEFEDLLHDNT